MARAEWRAPCARANERAAIKTDLTCSTSVPTASRFTGHRTCSGMAGRLSVRCGAHGSHPQPIMFRPRSSAPRCQCRGVHRAWSCGCGAPNAHRAGGLDEISPDHSPAQDEHQVQFATVTGRGWSPRQDERVASFWAVERGRRYISMPPLSAECLLAAQHPLISSLCSHGVPRGVGTTSSYPGTRRRGHRGAYDRP